MFDPYSRFIDYFSMMFEHITGSKLILNKHHYEMAEGLERVFYREVNNLLIEVPPGSQKTTMLSYFLSWAHGYYPEARSIACSKAKEFTVEKYTMTIAQIMGSTLYKELFPENVIDQKKRERQDVFDTIHGGFVYAVGAEGDIGGRRVGTGVKGVFQGTWVFDDLIELDKGMYSDTKRESINRWHDSAIPSRRNVIGYDPNIYIAQRLHHDDIMGHVKEYYGDDCEVITVKGIDESGASFWEHFHPAVELLKQKKRNPREFMAQIQQSPNLEGGNLVSVDKITSLDELPKTTKKVLSIDTSMSDREASDPWGFVIMSQFDTNKHIIQQAFAKQYGLNTGLECVVSVCNSEGVDTILVEEKALGQELVDNLKKNKAIKELRINIIGIDNKNSPLRNNKALRMVSANETVDSGNVFCYKFGQGVTEFMQKLSIFPESTDDHEADAFSQYLNYYKSKGDFIPRGMIRI